jgi:hypothetical protein
MPFRAEARIRLGDRIEIVVEQPNGGRALVVGTLDKVPVATGGLALQIVVCDAQVQALPATSSPRL